MRVAALILSGVALLGLVQTALAQAPPPYIQPGLVFVYQMVDMQKGQPENLFHRYIIESVTAQGIRISIQSDVVKPGVVTVDAKGEFRPGERIDLWIPPGLTPGTRLKIMGVDAVVAQTGYDLGQGLKVTLVASTDQSIIWAYIDDGPQPFNQLKQLMIAVVFMQTKTGLQLVNIEQAGSVTTTSTYTSPTTYRTTSAYTTMRTTVTGETTVTIVETETRTATVVSTVTHTTATTYATTRTETVQHQAEPPASPIPLTVAIPVAAAVVGGGFFYMRSRRRPLPPTYPYPPYPTVPPGYTPQPPGPPFYQQPVMACPACRFPVYPGEFVCSRCGYRVR